MQNLNSITNPFAVAAILAVSAGTAGAAFSQDALTYPDARRGDHVDTYHGEKVGDPYRWLEDLESEETRAWVKAEDKLTRSYLDIPGRERIRRQMETLVGVERIIRVRQTRKGLLFVRSTDFPADQRVYLRSRDTGAERLLLAPPYHAAKSEPADADPRLGTVWVNLQGTYLAYLMVPGTERWGTVRIIDLDTGKILPDRLEGLHTLSSTVAWLPDGSGLFYPRFKARLDTAGNRVPDGQAIYFHRLGTAQSEDRLIFEAPGDDWLASPSVTDNGAFLILDLRQGTEAENQILVVGLSRDSAQAQRYLAGRPGNYMYVGSDANRVLLFSDYQAPRGKIVAIDAAGAADQTPVQVIAEQPETINHNRFFGGGMMAHVGKRIAIVYTRDAQPVIKLFGMDGRLSHEIDLGDGGLIASLSGLPDEPELLINSGTLASPGRAFAVDTETGTVRKAIESDLPFEPEIFAVRRVFYDSANGTRVPMYLVHRKDLDLSKPAPAFIYAYGAFGWTAGLFYRPYIVQWMLEGGVYAQPGIRGGGEYGEEWYAAGRRTNKPNAIADYIAAAEWLVREGVTTPEMLVANGGSASGMLPAAAMNQRPDLFGAAIIDYPVIDMLRYEQFDNGHFWTGDAGSVENADEFRVLRSYSPLNNLRLGACYPATMIMVGEKDRSATPIHGYKYAAALQHAQGCDAPVLMNLMEGAGHNFGMTREQKIISRTDQMMFLKRVLGLQDIAETSKASDR